MPEINKLKSDPPAWLSKNSLEMRRVPAYIQTPVRVRRLNRAGSFPAALYKAPGNLMQGMGYRVDPERIWSYETKPVAFASMDSWANNAYSAYVSYDEQKLKKPTRILYLPQVGDAVAFMKLPTETPTPTLVMTAPLSGCSMFVSHRKGQYILYHANGNHVEARHKAGWMEAHVKQAAHTMGHELILQGDARWYHEQLYLFGKKEGKAQDCVGSPTIVCVGWCNKNASEWNFAIQVSFASGASQAYRKLLPLQSWPQNPRPYMSMFDVAKKIDNPGLYAPHWKVESVASVGGPAFVDEDE